MDHKELERLLNVCKTRCMLWLIGILITAAMVFTSAGWAVITRHTDSKLDKEVFTQYKELDKKQHRAIAKDACDMKVWIWRLYSLNVPQAKKMPEPSCYQNDILEKE